MRRGFKTQAKWLALEVRAEVGIGRFDLFDPYALAEEYGIPVYPLTGLAQDDRALEAVAYYAGAGSSFFSAALVPVGDKRVILDNDFHAPVRRRNSVSHEMSHVLLEHEFGELLLTSERCRAHDKDQEDEADWLAGELLIPYAAAERAARQDLTDEEVADAFSVSTRLAAMRMNYSGARTVVRRQQSYRRGAARN
jgi:Zn-dependent peptidase ImmA (M78 family)